MCIHSSGLLARCYSGHVTKTEKTSAGNGGDSYTFSVLVCVNILLNLTLFPCENVKFLSDRDKG